MCRIWSEEPPYRIEGEFYRTTTERFLDRSIGVGVAVHPRQRPHLPIAITSIRPDSRGPYTAGTRGWTGISATYAGAYVVQSQIRGYLEGRRSAGLSVDASGWRVARSIFVADDETTARRYAHREDGAHGFYFHVMRMKLAKVGGLDLMRDHPGQPDSELSTRRCIERLVIAGTRRASRIRSSRCALRSVSLARCSTPGTIGPIRRWRVAPWSSWPLRCGPGSMRPCTAHLLNDRRHHPPGQRMLARRGSRRPIS